MVANENVVFLFLMYLLSMKGAQPGTADLHGVAGGGNSHYAAPVTSMKEAGFKNTIRQQFDFSCGSAALATLLTYDYGAPVTEHAVFTAMYERGDQQKIRREGFSLLDMKVYLEENGYDADGYYTSLDTLARGPESAFVHGDQPEEPGRDNAASARPKRFLTFAPKRNEWSFRGARSPAQCWP